MSVKSRARKRAQVLMRRYEIAEIERRTGKIPTLEHAIRRDYTVMRSVARGGEIRTDHVEITHHSIVNDGKMRRAGDAPLAKSQRRAAIARRAFARAEQRYSVRGH